MRNLLMGTVAWMLLGSVAVADDKDDVATAAKKASELESYAFKFTVEVEGAPMPMDPMEFNGKFAKETAAYVSGAMMGQDFEAYKKGEKVAFKGMDGEWELASGRRAGGRGPMGGMMLGRSMKLPHEELKDGEKKLKEIKKAEAKEKVGEKECSLYEGELTEEAVKELLPMGRMPGMGEAEISGKVKMWIDAEGVIRKYELTASMAIPIQDNQMNLKIVRVTEFSGIGETRVEVPDEVTKLFEQKDEEKKDGEKKDNP